MAKPQMMEAEKLAEEILTDKEEIIAFDKRRNLNREAWRALESTRDEKAWLCSGKNLFIELPKAKARVIIEQEQKTLEKEINSLRDNLKVKTSKLSKLEGGPDASQPFFLKPTKPSELVVNTGKLTETITDYDK